MRQIDVRHLRLATVAGCAALLACVAGAPAFAEDDATPAAPAVDDTAELAKKLQNPIASLISVPFQSNFEWGLGHRSRGFKYTLNLQPVIPISISEHWTGACASR